MPTYAYACTACNHRFDAVQSFSDDALTLCPECGGALRKEYGSIGVTFNGPGFYRTDSRESASTGSKSGSKASSSSASESSSTSSTTKPAPAATSSSATAAN